MIKVYKKGVLQEENQDYVIDPNQSTITFSGNPIPFNIGYNIPLNDDIRNLNFFSEKDGFFLSYKLDLLLVESDKITTFSALRVQRISNEYLRIFEEYMK